MKLIFEVPGSPQGKRRPRFARVGKFIRTYTPKKTESYEEMIRGYAIRAGATPMEGPLLMNIRMIRAIPKSASEKKRFNMEHKPCTSRPDSDNVLKLVCDALNGVAYADDAQITMASVVKTWGREGRLLVEISELKEAV